MYSTTLAYLLWFISGGGVLGFHRFYLGKFGTGFLYMISGGLFGIGALYDLLTLPMQVREANLRLGYRNALYGYSDRTGRIWDVSPGASRGAGAEKKESMEKVILRTAKKNRGIATPAEVALEGDFSLDAVKKALDTLVEKGFADIRVSKKGAVVYFFQEFSGGSSHPDLEDF